MEREELQTKLIDLLLNTKHLGCLVIVITKTGTINIKGVANKEVFNIMGEEVLIAEKVLFKYLNGELEPGTIKYPIGVN